LGGYPRVVEVGAHELGPPGSEPGLAVDNDHVVTGLDKHGGDVRADEAPASGD
jgi:hypothetical protein